jgi:hypothetical protein
MNMKELKVKVAEVIAANPEATYYGLKMGGNGWGDVSESQYLEISLCVEFIEKLCRKTVNINLQAGTSYTLKHKVERWICAIGRKHTYIGNGSFIVAALVLGYSYKGKNKKQEYCILNPFFNISKPKEL